jgi:tetratricopeptide (TPR) repeat protein
LRAQAEIAETYYLQGKHEEAGEYFNRLLKLDSPELDRPKSLCRLIQCLAARGAHAEVVAQGSLFLDRYPEAGHAAEVRYMLSNALQKLGRNDEARQHVLALLQTQQQGAGEDPQSWNYWRQRTGNDIANQFYQQADFANALQVYSCLANLSSAPEWQVPALYQTGLVYERLRQTDKALETYARIVQAPPGGGLEASPSLAAILEMAAWRKAHLAWQQTADQSARRLLPPNPTSLEP